jgi:hypothetical protein
MADNPVLDLSDLPLPWRYAKEHGCLLAADGTPIDWSLDVDVFDEVKRFEAKAVNCHAEMRNALKECLALIKDLSRGVGKMALQDYQRFNEAPIAARRALKKAGVACREIA